MPKHPEKRRPLLRTAVVACMAGGMLASTVALSTDSHAAVNPWPIQRIEEDDPSWDCRTMGDRICGDSQLRAALNRCDFWYFEGGQAWTACRAEAKAAARLRASDGAFGQFGGVAFTVGVFADARYDQDIKRCKKWFKPTWSPWYKSCAHKARQARDARAANGSQGATRGSRWSSI